jgi:hypothetical protein
MGCSPLDDLAELQIAVSALNITGSAEIRRDVIANRGTASDFQAQFFIENRQGSLLGDQLFLSVQLGSTSWDWLRIAGVN